MIRVATADDVEVVAQLLCDFRDHEGRHWPPDATMRAGVERLIGREDGKLHILPHGAGQRQTVVTDPPWAAVAVRLIRAL